MTTLRDILLEMLGNPPTYDDGVNGRHPVDLSCLDTPIAGYQSPDMQGTYRQVAEATRTYHFLPFEKK